jgi:glutaredoxin
MATAAPKKATIYRMVMPAHTCPYGVKAKDLLRRQGYEVEDHWLRTREDTDAFKAEHDVKTTPQTFIGGERVGGFDDLRRFFGKAVRDPKAVTYRPVVAVFAMTGRCRGRADGGRCAHLAVGADRARYRDDRCGIRHQGGLCRQARTQVRLRGRR